MNAHVSPEAAHAVYAPSSAHRWTVCTASAAAIGQLGEQEEGAEAAEGTRAHDEIERVLGHLNASTAPLVAVPAIEPDHDHPAAYGIALVLAYMRGLAPGRVWVEQRVYLTEQIWGRCDVAHWHEPSATLTIVDYKNGQRAVDVEENEQLRIYAAASIATHNLPAQWIRYVVVQPNDWRPFVSRVKQWFEGVDALQTWVAKISTIPTQPLTFTAGDHCRDCPLFGRCSASLDLLTNVGALVSGLVQPANVRPEQVAAFLAMQKPVEDAFKGFKKYWETQSLKSGNPPPAMKIVTTGPHRAWTNPEAARALVLAELGPSGLDVPTPAQAIERGLSEKTVHEMAPRPAGGPVLAFESDKRKPWVAKSVESMFSGVATQFPR